MAAEATRPTRHRLTVRFIGYSSVLLRKPTSTPVFHHRVRRMSDVDGYSASSGYHYFSENSGKPVERKTVKTDTFGLIKKCRRIPPDCFLLARPPHAVSTSEINWPSQAMMPERKDCRYERD